MHFHQSSQKVCITQMCPLCVEDDGGARQIGTYLQEDWNLTLIHKFWSFPAVSHGWRPHRGGWRWCFVFGQHNEHLSNKQQYNHVQSRAIISAFEVNSNNIQYMKTNSFSFKKQNHCSCTVLQMNDWATSNSKMKDFLPVFVQRKLIMKRHWSVKSQ